MRWFARSVFGLVGAVAAAGGVGLAAVGGGNRMETPPSAEKAIAAIDRALAGDGETASLAKAMPPHSPVRDALEAGDLKAAREMLAFRPLDEAPIPEGFPAFTPAGMIEVKQYPAYRKATGDGFWPLFQHIQTRGIPMTAPVEMGAGTSSRGDGEMAFLYQNTEVGSLGPMDGVQVEDTPPATYASLGLRGNTNREKAADARKRLQAWLAANPDYVAAEGDEEPFRVLGYNSPMVRGNDRYWEAQLRVKKAAAE